MKLRTSSSLLVILVCLATALPAQSFRNGKGDVNNDGSINVLDMVTLANHILGIATLDEQGLWRADLNGPVGNCDGDGSANVLDMVKTANIILQSDACPDMWCTAVTDIDGNMYQTVQIGDQCWMAENLKVTHYRNRDPIPNMTDDSEWAGLSTGAYSYYLNDPNNVDYNWYAVADSRNIAPEGWHVPTDADWDTLVNYLGGYLVAGGKMKTTGTIEEGTGLWRTPNVGATNESGFSALPYGYRNSNGLIGRQGDIAIFWSSTEVISSLAWKRNLNNSGADVNRNHSDKRCGYSVRCLRDN